MKRLLVLLLSSVLSSALSAQTVWRCGPDGRSFQAVPCTDGHTVALRAAPGMEALPEARAVAARERQALAQLTRQLVVKQGCRLEHQGSCQSGSFLHAARKLAGKLIFNVLQLKCFKLFNDSFADFLLR